MKKLFLSLLLIATFAVSGFAQQMPPMPLDTAVRIGKLENGMTYYIRHNEKPAQRADFYIAQKVGSILEEEEQRGLAHFLEHMAFNGTKNLPGLTLRNYLQDNGIKFGENLNAGTGIDQTVYMITNVPTTNPGLVDTCLMILHDWSSFIALEEKEIDNERGVILEELRTREDAQQRIWETLLPQMYPNSPYANRLPGGLPEVVANFKYQTLRDYYNKWYRPDLQGLIIVGDIDVDAIEAKIKEMCADIPTPVNPAERTRFEIADNEEPIVAICSDPEQTHYNIQVFFKQDATPDSLKNSMEYWMTQYLLNIVSEMYNNRMNEITQKPNAPFVYGYGYYGDYYIAPTKDAWCGLAMAKDRNGINDALTALIHENKRMELGFTASEYERAKADFMKYVESQYAEKNNTVNGKYVYECLDNFLSNEPMPGIETEYMMYQQIVPNLPLELINEMVKELIPENNLVITITAPQKEGETLPTKDEILAVYEKANADVIEPYKEEVFEGPLVENLPEPGSIKKETLLPEFGAMELTLSNGMKVIYKQTNFQEDEIVMSATSKGGVSAIYDKNINDSYTLQELNDIITLGGVGNFSAIDLPKVLAGKIVDVEPFISTYSEGMHGSCSPKDLETMMQLIYLYFTSPRADEEAFESYIQRTKAIVENMELNPMMTLQDSINSVLYKNHPLRFRMKAADYDKVNYAKAMEIYRERFSDPNNFTFTFVGNIDVETFKPLVEQYLASLKANKRKEKSKDINLAISKESRINHYEKQMENPKTSVYVIYNGDMKYNYKNQVYMDVLTDVLDIVYTQKIREDEGGTYGVGVMGNVSKLPKGNFMMLIAFDTNKDVYKKLMGIAFDELQNIADNGPRQEDLQKVLENKLKKRAELLEENSFWRSAIETYIEDDANILYKYKCLIKDIDAQKIADFAKKVLKGYKKEVVQMPAR